MPTNLMLVDNQFPRLDQGENTQESITKLQNYLYMLVEQLRYSLHNLDLSNLNQTAWDEMKLEISKPIYVALENSTGGTAELEATVNGLKSTVEQQGQSISEFQQTAHSLQISVESLQTGLSNTVYVDSYGLVVSNQDGEAVQISGGAIKADTSITSPIIVLKTSVDEDTESTSGGAIYIMPEGLAYPVGSIYYHKITNPSSSQSMYNLFITTQSGDITQGKVGAALKIRSGYRLSLEAKTGIYIACEDPYNLGYATKFGGNVDFTGANVTGVTATFG